MPRGKIGMPLNPLSSSTRPERNYLSKVPKHSPENARDKRLHAYQYQIQDKPGISSGHFSVHGPPEDLRHPLQVSPARLRLHASDYPFRHPPESRRRV